MNIQIFSLTERHLMGKNANTNTICKAFMMRLQQTTFMIKLSGAACSVKTASKCARRSRPHLLTKATPLTYVHEIYCGHLMQQINMVHLPMNVAKSRSNVNPLSGPRSFHLWKATRIFTLDLSRNLTKCFFSAFLASSLCFSLLFLRPAVDRREMGIFFGFVLSSIMSASEAQGNRLTQGRGCPRWACLLSARETIDTRRSRLLSLIGCLLSVAVVSCKYNQIDCGQRFFFVTDPFIHVLLSGLDSFNKYVIYCINIYV